MLSFDGEVKGYYRSLLQLIRLVNH